MRTLLPRPAIRWHHPLLLLALLAPATARADKAPAPTAQLKQQNERLQKILKRHPAAGSPAEAQARDELRRLVGELLDYGELAQRALGPHWEKMTKPQQTDFTATLRDLIERNYVKQLRSTLDYDIVYKSEAVDGESAEVQTIVKAHTKGKTTEVTIDYKLKRGPDRWQVYDVVTDELSLVKNYRAQFNKIIAAESYDGLLKKMRKKLEEVEKS